MIRAIDASTNVVPHLNDLKGRGVRAIGRYYSRSSWKALTPREAELISKAGFKIFVVYEDKGSDPTTFSEQSGRFQGQMALTSAKRIGQTAGSAIYFGADFNATESDVVDRLIPFFSAVHDVFKSSPDNLDFKIGVYSNGHACGRLLDEKLCGYAWLSCSKSFLGYEEFYNSRRWALAQHVPVTWDGLELDPDEDNGEFGAFTLAADGTDMSGPAAGVPAQAVTALVVGAAPGVPSIVTIATGEFDKFGGTNEGTEPLRSRIADYYEAGGGSRDLDPTLDENAWSAAFVSFCVMKSGVSAAQFAFSLSHSVYAKAAIANNDAGVGVFRGHPIADYAPKLGAIIHHNRSGGSITFEFARQHSGYPSHAAIVVGFDTAGGVRRAVTIGGNEFLQGGTGTVGKKFFPLDSQGLLDQSKIGPKLICVIENKLAAGTAIPQVPGPYLVSVRTDLKLRGGPSPTFPIIASLPDGTKLNVLQFVDSDSGRWALVDLKGDGNKDGYVFSQFINPAPV